MTFPLTKKSDVNGDNTNEVFKWLKEQKAGILGLQRIKVRSFVLNSLRLLISDSLCVRSGISRSSSLTRTAWCDTAGRRRPRPTQSTRRLRNYSRSESRTLLPFQRGLFICIIFSQGRGRLRLCCKSVFDAMYECYFVRMPMFTC